MQRYFLLVLGFVLLSGMAQAGEPRLAGSYKNWDSYVFTEESKKVCYIASRPQKSEGKYNQRGDVFALITHRPADGTKNVFSYIAGYDYKKDSEVEVQIDSQTFKLFTQDDTAWTPDSETDQKLAQALRGGTKMVVKGISTRGTTTKDIFSLSGSGAAFDKINQECSG